MMTILNRLRKRQTHREHSDRPLHVVLIEGVEIPVDKFEEKAEDSASFFDADVSPRYEVTAVIKFFGGGRVEWEEIDYVTQADIDADDRIRKSQEAGLPEVDPIIGAATTWSGLSCANPETRKPQE